MGAESPTLLDHCTKTPGEAVTDPGFPRGANLTVRCTNLLLGQIFAKSCMKMIEFGLRGARTSSALLGSATARYSDPCFNELVTLTFIDCHSSSGICCNGEHTRFEFCKKNKRKEGCLSPKNLIGGPKIKVQCIIFLIE